MAENKGSDARQGAAQVPDQGVGFTKEDAAGTASGGQSQQGAGGGSSSGHYTGAPGSSRQGFVPSTPEGNVFPKGAPQSGHGSAADHEVAGGTAGAIEASRNRQSDPQADAPETDGGSGDAGMGNRGSR